METLVLSLRRDYIYKSERHQLSLLSDNKKFIKTERFIYVATTTTVGDTDDKSNMSGM